MDDYYNLRTPVLDVHPQFGFEPLKTIRIIFCLIFFLLTVEIVTLAYVFIFTRSSVRCDLYCLVMYAEVCSWALFLIVRFYINWKHKICLMAKGYFDFYETASKYIEYAFYISNIWLGISLVITCLYVQTDPDNFCSSSFVYSPIVVVTTVFSIQNILLIPLFTKYIVKVHEFNKLQRPPDSENGNQWIPNTLRDAMVSEEIGYRERCEIIDAMLEKQADLIRYYKETNEVLNKQIFELTSQGRSLLLVDT